MAPKIAFRVPMPTHSSSNVFYNAVAVLKILHEYPSIQDGLGVDLTDF